MELVNSTIKEVFKNKVSVVVDRYHVAKLYRRELDKFRQKTLKQLKKELREHEYDQIIGATKILRRANECMTDDEKRNDSKLTCFKKFIGSPKKWKNEIANYFVSRQTSAFVEGLNNKIKVLKRRCYGIYDLKHLFQRLFLALSGYELYAIKIVV